MVKSVFRVVFGYPLGGGPDGFLQQVAGAGLCGAQPRFEFAKSEFNGVKVR